MSGVEVKSVRPPCGIPLMAGEEGGGSELQGREQEATLLGPDVRGNDKCWRIVGKTNYS